ncbi:MAG TPA: hypothetical protein VM100_01395, partial [Longimicrobiales bacterium]|nr:hypothetical protein [Longimicrobiales bacterium]
MFSSMEDAHANSCNPLALFLEPCLLPTLAVPETLDSIASGTHVRVTGDTLTFAVEISGVKSVSIVGGIESTMQRIGGNLWAATVFVPRASEAIISYRFLTDTMTVAPQRR